MLSEKYLRKQIRKQLLKLVFESQNKRLKEAPDTEEADPAAEDEETVAARGKIKTGLGYIFPDEEFKLPSNAAQLESMVSMFRTAIETAQAGKAKTAATSMDRSTKSMNLPEGKRRSKRRRS